MSVCDSYNSKTTGPNLMKLGGMIGNDPRTNRSVFGSNWVKGQGQGHQKVKNVFLREFGQLLSD